MEPCNFPKCKNKATLGYIGRGICEEHWQKLCDANSKIEKKMLLKIGLKRDKNGKVVPTVEYNEE